jgi:hypothetical protein
VDASTWLQLVSTLALSAAVIFAAVEWRATRRDRARQRQIMLLRSFDSPEFTKAMRTVMDLPNGRSKREIDGQPETADLVWFWLGVMEQIGFFVRSGELDLRLVDQTFSGPVQVTGAKLARYVADGRREYGSETMYEYGTWLAERLAEYRRERGRAPAYQEETSATKEVTLVE